MLNGNVHARMLRRRDPFDVSLRTALYFVTPVLLLANVARQLCERTQTNCYDFCTESERGNKFVRLPQFSNTQSVREKGNEHKYIKSAENRISKSTWSQL